MSKEPQGKQGGGSSSKDGPNERANDAAKSVSLNQDQKRELHDQIHGQNLTFKEIQEIAKDIKNGQ